MTHRHSTVSGSDQLFQQNPSSVPFPACEPPARPERPEFQTCRAKQGYLYYKQCSYRKDT
eukprot:scaffold889_cov379-Prasinococcus_capsulatus_cf.AAC.7